MLRARRGRPRGRRRRRVRARPPYSPCGITTACAALGRVGARGVGLRHGRSSGRQPRESARRVRSSEAAALEGVVLGLHERRAARRARAATATTPRRRSSQPCGVDDVGAAGERDEARDRGEEEQAVADAARRARRSARPTRSRRAGSGSSGWTRDAGRGGVAVVARRCEVDGAALRGKGGDERGGVVGDAAPSALLDHQHPSGATRSVARNHGCERTGRTLR